MLETVYGQLDWVYILDIVNTDIINAQKANQICQTTKKKIFHILKILKVK